MEKKLVLCDTNIIIEFYKGNGKIVEILQKIGVENIVIRSITATELVFGAINKTELKTIIADIEQLTLFPLNETISEQFLNLMQQYSLSHKLDIPDALIAATALVNDLELYTLNVKHFKYIHILKLFQ